MVRTPYICPRCNHTTILKGNMRNHFSRKRICSDNNGLILTEEIMETVLQNHVYHPRVDIGPSTNTTIINNYNNQHNIMNIIGQMDTYDKMSKFLEYNHKELYDFRYCVDEKVDTRVKKLDGDIFKSFQIEQADILGLIDDITRVQPDATETMNILFDKKLNSIRMYFNHKWNIFWLDVGVIELMKIIKESYLDSYETYLIRKIYHYDTLASAQQCYESFLEDYYRFIINFDLPPYICECGLTDKEIIGRELKETNPTFLDTHYAQVYGKLKKEAKRGQKLEIRKHIVNIIKRNTIQNIDELNRDIFAVIKMDEEFKTHIFDVKVDITGSKMAPVSI